MLLTDRAFDSFLFFHSEQKRIQQRKLIASSRFWEKLSRRKEKNSREKLICLMYFLQTSLKPGESTGFTVGSLIIFPLFVLFMHQVILQTVLLLMMRWCLCGGTGLLWRSARIPKEKWETPQEKWISHEYPMYNIELMVTTCNSVPILLLVWWWENCPYCYFPFTPVICIL